MNAFEVLGLKEDADESQVLSVRMPKGMLKDLDAIAQKTGRTRNELIVMSIEFTLDHLEIEEK